MSTCKDCLHYEACQYHITEETDMTVNECSHGFKNKADYVEVVRCKDCENCHEYQKWNFDRYLGCNFNGEIYEVKPTHFCSYGKKKGGAE